MGAGEGEWSADGVDFRAARRQIEELVEVPVGIRQRALAAYVAVFDYADRDGIVALAGEAIAADLEISKVSWLRYRGVLERAGLLSVGLSRGGNATALRLHRPHG